MLSCPAQVQRAAPERQKEFLNQAVTQFNKALALDSENVPAHHNLSLIYALLGDEKKAAEHRALHDRYREDNNARDRAIAIERRRNPAADHAAQATVIYPLQRTGAPELGSNELAKSEKPQER